MLIATLQEELVKTFSGQALSKPIRATSSHTPNNNNNNDKQLVVVTGGDVPNQHF